jgi:hypothetical protein
MTETLTPVEPARDEVPLREAFIEDGLVAGRPVEDRGFEAVEVGAGAMAGFLVGTVVAGPIGAAAGGLLGGAAALVAGEALERHEGRAAETTDTVD